MVESDVVSHPNRVRTESEAWVVRLGAWGGLVGSLLAMIGNLLHPATPEHDPLGVARMIAESQIWVPVHLVIVVGLILMLGGLVAISRSVVGGPPGALSQLGLWAGVAGIAVGVILVIIDGVAAKHLADVWREAPAAEAPVALRVVVAEESINFALAALFNILFAGVTFMLLGLAVALSGEHPRGPAWAVVLAGVLSIPVALVQAYQGETVAFTRIATIISPTVITLWVIWMCVRLLRSPPSAANLRDAAAGSIT